MLNSRIKRVEELIQQELAKILNYELRDPRISFITVTHIRVARDLSDSIVFVSFLEEDPAKIEEAMKGLNAAKGYIKRILAERISLKRLPDLHFKRDESYADTVHMEEIFHKIEQERQPEDKKEEAED